MNDSTHRYKYENFEIFVGKKTKRGYPLIVNQAPAGDARAFFRLNSTHASFDALSMALANNQANELLLQQVGDLLFKTLFTADIATLYRASLSRVRGQDIWLRIRLTLEPPELAALPWEFLYDSQEDAFLAISPETTLVRYMPIQAPVSVTTIHLPLRILVVIAAPKDVQPLESQREQIIIQDALAQWIAQEQVSLHFVKQATVAQISQAMREVQPHIFHFIGHSRFEQEQGYVLLEDEAGYAKPVNERVFREFFTSYPEMRLAVLNTCETATTSIHQPLVGMVPRLLQRHLSAIVAMQYPILDTTSLIFTREFYRSLALGYSIENAITEARRGIYLEMGGQTADWGVPVLFLRAQDGQLFHIEPTAEMAAPPALLRADITENAVMADPRIAAIGDDLVSRDKIIQGDEVHGDKIAGDKIAGNKNEVHIGRVEPGAQVIVGDVQITQAPPLEIPLPPEPTRPPEPSGFVGRKVELAYYMERMQTMHFAAICGMAGVGKSTLAAVLAQRAAAPDKVFWYSFHAEEGFEPILWQLGGFLAHHGQDELWQMLHTAWQTRRESLPPITLFNYLLQLIRNQGYVLCLDDFHFVDDDPLVTHLVERLRTLLAAGELSLIITSRRLPNFVKTIEFAALNGLSPADTHDLLAVRGLALADPLSANLHTITEGNPQLLTLAIEAVRHTNDPARLIARLLETSDIERYLMHEVDEGLSTAERTVMSAVAVLLGYFGTREAIEVTVGGDSVRRALHDLSTRYLLMVRETEQGREYGQHATLQAFYYDLLGQRERVAMHRRAGDHYARLELDVLKAARHYQYAGEFTQATELAVQNLWAIINQGQSQALRQLLDRFTTGQLNTIQWAQVNLACGQMYTLLGEGELARKSFETVLTSSATLASPDRQKLRMQVYEGMGWLLEQESPQEALNWLQRGLQELADAGNREEAALYIRIGSVQSAVGEFAAALQSLQRGLALLPETPSQLRASALMNIGNIYSTQGDSEQGNDYYRQALAISEQLHDDFRILAIRSNLAIDKEIVGNWSDAIADYQQALALAERLGSVVDQVRLANSLGTIYTKRGDDALATDYLEHAIAVARAHQNHEDLAYSLTSLADLKMRLGETAVVTAALTEAEQLAQELDLESLLAEIHCLWAQLYLQRSEPQRAVDYAERSVRSAQDLDLKVEEGKFLRTLGRAQADHGQDKQALATMAQSLALLVDRDPYEAACTKIAWGQLLAVNGDVAQGQSLLQEAFGVFRKLGAQRDLLAVNQWLHNTNSAAS